MNSLIFELKCYLDTTNDVPRLMNADFINAVSFRIILAMGKCIIFDSVIVRTAQRNSYTPYTLI